jgi:hypothetical protein
MNDSDAAAAAKAYGGDHFPELADRDWRTTPFDGGWLATPIGEDLRWRTGLPCLVVLADGSVHRESSSSPPPTLIAKYRAAPLDDTPPSQHSPEEGA